MDYIEQQARLQNIIGKNRKFENLLANSDFLEWKNEVIIPRLESIKSAILSVDRTNDNWKEIVCDAVISYQEALLTYETLFGISASAGRQARVALQKLTEAPEQFS